MFCLSKSLNLGKSRRSLLCDQGVFHCVPGGRTVDYTIEPMSRPKMREVLEIELASNTVEDPDFGLVPTLNFWTEIDFAKYGKKTNTSGIVIKEGDSVVGFCVYEKKQDKLVIDKLVVHPLFRRSKFGTVLITYVVAENNVKVYQFIVRETDISSIEFYRTFKFKSRLSLNHFKDGEDAIIFYKVKF